MMKRILIVSVLLLCAASSLVALGAPQVDAINLRSKAMGGTALGFADDQYALLNNPAGMSVLRTTWISIIQAHITISGDFLDVWDQKDEFAALKDNQNYNISNSTWNFITRLKIAAGTTPLYFAMLNVLPFNINVAVFNTLTAKVTTNPDIPLPTWNLTTYNDTVFLANLAFPLIDFKFINIHAGVNAKLVHRLLYQQNRIDIFKMYYLSNLDVDKFDVYRALGFGMDIGFMAEMGKRMKIGLTMTDFFGTTFSWTKLDDPTDPLGSGTDAGSSTIDPSLNLGVSYRIGTIIPLFIENLVIAADMRNLFDGDRAFFLNMYIGAEFSMFGGWLKIRTGLYQGWLSAGIGIDIPVLPLEIAFAYWGEELGEYPGQERVDNIGLTINLVW